MPFLSQDFSPTELVVLAIIAVLLILAVLFFYMKNKEPMSSIVGLILTGLGVLCTIPFELGLVLPQWEDVVLIIATILVFSGIVMGYLSEYRKNRRTGTKRTGVRKVISITAKIIVLIGFLNCVVAFIKIYFFEN